MCPSARARCSCCRRKFRIHRSVPRAASGLVVERRRGPDELDGFSWYCENCGQLLYLERVAVPTSKRSCRKSSRAFIPSWRAAPAASAAQSCRRPPDRATILSADAGGGSGRARPARAILRRNFIIRTTPPAASCVYLCGHSLGLQPNPRPGYVEQELDDWRRLGVLGHPRRRRGHGFPITSARPPGLAALAGAMQAKSWR